MPQPAGVWGSWLATSEMSLLSFQTQKKLCMMTFRRRIRTLSQVWSCWARMGMDVLGCRMLGYVGLGVSLVGCRRMVQFIPTLRSTDVKNNSNKPSYTRLPNVWYQWTHKGNQEKVVFSD